MDSKALPSLPSTGRSARFGMRLLLLFITCCGAWIAYFAARNSISTELRRIEQLHQFAPELYIRNSNEYACLAIDRTDSQREYHCYLPAGRKYRLNLKWKEAFPLRQPTSPDLTHELDSGTYRIYFDIGSRLVVRVDDMVVFDEPFTDPAKRSSYTTHGASSTFQGQWQDPTTPLILLSRTEYIPNGPTDSPTEGVALWIDRTD